MLPSYNFLCIPLDTRNPSSADKSFSMNIVTELQFPMDFPHDPATIRNALGQHPLLVGSRKQPISAFVWSYRRWLANGRSMDPRAALRTNVTFSDTTSLSTMSNNLLDYLGAGKETLIPAHLLHDCSYENLEPEHFVHVTQAADDLRFITNSIKVAALQSLVAQRQSRAKLPAVNGGIADLTNLTNVSFALAKWIDGAMHSALLGTLYEEDETRRNQLYSEFGVHADKIKDIKKAIEKITKRITKEQQRNCPPPAPRQLKGFACKGESQTIDLADPNLAIHSAIKNALLAKACGFVTSWTVEAITPIYGEQDYVIQLDVSSLLYDKTKVDVLPSLPTAFRRTGHTHPVSYGDIGSQETTNCALACLTNNTGQTRYRATSVNAEIGLAKQLILQFKNSLPGPSASAESNFGKFDSRNPDTLDLRVPQLLQNDRFGTPEPETSGVVFSAPPEDLVTPKALQFSSPEERYAALPCLFLEDLWIGYRLDIREENRGRFTSIHKLKQQITLTQTPNRKITGATEDYIEREQRDDPALGHSSTDLTTYNGLSSGQAKDYLILLGVNRPPDQNERQPFTTEILGYEKTERLTFRKTYEYRFRNVFTGSVSCDSSDSALDENTFSNKYRQKFPFYRARTLRPGEVFTVQQEDHEASSAAGRTIYLTANHPRTIVAIVPSPIDIDSSRFHGVLLASKNEEKSKRKHVTDLGKFFSELPPSDLNYFYDPDVYGVIIRAKVLNGDERLEPEGMTYSDGTYCRLIKHLDLTPITETYGRMGDWQRFKPIVISFQTSQDSVAQVRKGESARRIEVFVPPATELHLSLLPLFDLDLLSKTASFVASSAELQQQELKVSEAALLPIPAVAEHTIKVIHAVRDPRRPPKLFCQSPRWVNRVASKQESCLGGRLLDSEFGTVFGRVELDAASTKEVRLEAIWTDINDDPKQARYVLQTGKAMATPRSVVFREYEALYPSMANFRDFFLTGSPERPSKSLATFRLGSSMLDFSDQFALQCVEDEVFLGELPEAQQPVAGTSSRIDFKDQRRKLATVTAIAVGRFAQGLRPSSATADSRSNSVLVEIPSTVKMTAPKVSHIVPLRREFRDGDSKSGSRVAMFGVRIYLRKEWFQSGSGERLAIGCAAGGEPKSSDGADILKYVTQWGEDPIERAGLSSTTRMPRASDFIVPAGDVEDSDFDKELYPENAIGGRSPVIYRDNVALPPSDLVGEQRWVSVASYAVRYDQAQRLWYSDVQIGVEFFGRCGMALYRHQPNALDGRELSSVSAWVYAAMLYGEPVAWSEQQDNLHVTIGPVYDSSVSFDLDSLKYHDGISENLSKQDRVLHPLKSYRVAKALYFEAVVPKKNFTWGLFKKRFDYPVSSSRLRD